MDRKKIIEWRMEMQEHLRRLNTDFNNPDTQSAFSSLAEPTIKKYEERIAFLIEQETGSITKGEVI